MESATRRLASAAIAFVFVALCGPVHAQVNSSQRFELAIARSSLAEALSQFSRQTGLQIGTQLNVTTSDTHEIGPFVGYATVDETLRALLTGSDLWYTWQDENTIRVFRIPAQRRHWSTDVSTAREASDSIRQLSGRHYDPGSCGDYIVGPFASDQPITAEAYWIELIKPHCPVIYKRRGDLEPGSIDRLTPAGQTKHDFAIDEMPRFAAIRSISEQAGGLLIGYLSNGDEEERTLVGPIRGRMSVNEALVLVMRGTELRTRWAEENIVSVEPAYKVIAYADMSKCSCNFGLPEMKPLRSENVTVIRSRLPSLDEYVPAPIVEFSRREIEATGASNIPDLLRYATHFPYMRPKGDKLNGAQFADLRGLGPQYTLVLINGTRADVSASDLTTSAFDLNSVPISAVEKIEIGAGLPSLVHGMDAIGGIVNIVLRDGVPKPFADVRYGSAKRGARERIGTVAAGTSTDRAKTALFLDYFETTELLGAERERWRDMNYSRFGGPDRRSRFSAPPNVYTLDGENLPGLDASEAAVSVLPSGQIAFRPGQANLTSSLAMQAIVPEMRRASVTGLIGLDLGRAQLSADMLYVHRDAHFQMDAEIVPGFMMSSAHPQNPFGVPIAVDAALVGLPPRATDSRSELLRGTVKIEGPIGDSTWRYHSFLGGSKEQASAAQINFVDAAALSNGLATTGEDAVNILGARPGEGSRATLIGPRRSTSTEAEGSQMAARIEGQLPLLHVDTILGIEHRTEAARFSALVGRVQRHETSAFGTAKLPIGEHLDLTYGTRVDDFSDRERIRREQWGLTWRPTSVLELRAAYNEAFHAPSLIDLHLPRNVAPVPLFDPQRGEVTTVDFIFGGNPDLAPATGASSTVGVKLETDNGVTASVDFWRIRMRDHISPVPLLALLANESEAIAGRILRDTPTALDNDAGRPGRLLALDVSRANIGEVDARGIDISARKSFDTSVGTFTSRLDLTYTDAFRYNDLPIRNAPLRDRAGVASVLGTIPSWRGTYSVGYLGYGWDLAVFARYGSSYRDYNVALSAPSNRDIPARTLWDFTVSKNLGASVDLTIGVADLLDKAPPYAEVGDPAGFDISQGDLTGRTAFIRVNGSL